MRRFVRHPTDIPIKLSLSQATQKAAKNYAMKNIGIGGFCCEVDNELEIGALVDIHIPSVWPEYHGHGEVVWCNPKGDRYDIGISFADMEEAYKSRMVQQVCQIEHYKNTVFEREGRVLDGDEAAAEWIEKYAADFPR